MLCLRSGLPGCVPWALNALALASFQARPELLLPGLPGLLPALLQVGCWALPGNVFCFAALLIERYACPAGTLVDRHEEWMLCRPKVGGPSSLIYQI